MGAITLSHCSYTIHQTTILKNISGTIQEGMITTFIGPSGAGKSSLFRLINRLSPLSNGSIFFKEENIETSDPILLRQKIGIVFQEAVMIKGSVYDNLRLASDLHGTPFSKADARDLLKKVGLSEKYLDTSTKELSGGQKQKVSIARTLANKPEVLLLDEITASLDQVSAQAIEALILSLNKEEGLTILWITHNLKQARAIGDHTWVMIDGSVVFQGPVEDLAKTQDKAVLSFIEGGRKS